MRRNQRSTRILLFFVLLFIAVVIIAGKYKNQYKIEPILENNTYKQLQMCNENVGWAITEDNQILYTTKGYENFHPVRQIEKVDVVSNNYMYGEFFDESTAYIVYFSETGTKIVIEYTLNAGNSWHYTSIEHGNYGKSHSVYIDFVDKNNGYLLYCSKAGKGEYNKTLYLTQNGGVNFEMVSHLSDSIDGIPTGINFTTLKKGYIGTKDSKSKNFLYQTNDGGTIWRTQGLLEDEDIYDKTDFWTPFFYGAKKDGGKTLIKQSGKYSTQFVLMSTRSSGRVWLQEIILDFKDVKSFSFIDNSQGFVIDQDGKVYKLTKNRIVDLFKKTDIP